MHLDRRRFLAAGGLVLAGVPYASFAAVAAPRGRVVVEAGTAESVAFADAFSPAARIDCRLDAVRKLRAEVGRSLDAGVPVYACTREATRFVLGELFRGSGFALQLLGRHRRVAPLRWRHELYFGPAADLPALFERADWPVQYARILRPDTAATARPQRTLEVSSLPFARGSAHVLTWCLG